MKEYKLKAAPAALTQEIKNQKAPKAKRILVGIDTGLGNNQASRKVDNAAIGPVQNLRSETEIALYIDKQLELAEEVVVVYEAGPFGYGLYRQLTARGAKCLVCAPDSTQQKRKRRKNNSIDSRNLASNLSNYLNGNEAALQLVRVPTEEQERARLVSRQQDQLVEERKRLGAQGNALLLSQGFGSWKNWWRPQAFKALQRVAPECLAGMVPSEWSTGKSQRLGSITKVGVPAIRRIIPEMVWRMILFQPHYPPVLKWQEVLRGTNKTLKKKAVVATGRQLIVDLWRLQTGRSSAQELKLVMIGG